MAIDAQSVTAVLVDGVGRTRVLELRERVGHIRIPKSKPFTWAVDEQPEICFDDIQFEYVGGLPDGRVVYGFMFHDGCQYQLWNLSASWMKEAGSKAEQAVDHQIQNEINALHAVKPVVSLYDKTVDSGHVFRREVFGVARRRT